MFPCADIFCDREIQTFADDIVQMYILVKK